MNEGAELTIRVAALGLAPDEIEGVRLDLAAETEPVELLVAPELDERLLEALAKADLMVVDPKALGDPSVNSLRRLRAAAPRASLIVLTRYADSDDLHEVVQVGGIERYWLKPWSREHGADLERMVGEIREERRRAERHRRLEAERARLERDNQALRDESRGRFDWSHFPHASVAMRRTIESAKAFAAEATDLCILGEPGSGRASLALAIHFGGARAREPLVRLPSSTLQRGSRAPSSVTATGDPPDGAGIGAALRVAAKWEAARGGTLFIASIEDLDDAAQAVLAGLAHADAQVGGRRPRLIASASAPPRTLVAEGLLHPHLGQRFEPHVLEVPPLRERSRDLAELTAQLLTAHAALHGGTVPTLSANALAQLCALELPGNIPELRERLVEASVFAPGDFIERLPRA